MYSILLYLFTQQGEQTGRHKEKSLRPEMHAQKTKKCTRKDNNPL